MKNLIQRNYDSTVKRGKITYKTTHAEFIDKEIEEDREFFHEIGSINLTSPVVNEIISKKAAIEVVDKILVNLNYLHHNGYDVLELIEEKIIINEQRK